MLVVNSTTTTQLGVLAQLWLEEGEEDFPFKCEEEPEEEEEDDIDDEPEVVDLPQGGEAVFPGGAKVQLPPGTVVTIH